MAVKLFFSVEEVGGVETVKRKLNGILKETFRSGGEVWFSRILQRHFRGGAASDYGYEPRTAKYLRRKTRQFGHTRPLEYTGDMKRDLMRRAKITPTKSRVSVTVYGPRYLRPPGKPWGKQPDMGAEITRMSSRDVKLIMKTMDRRFGTELRAVRDRTRRRI